MTKNTPTLLLGTKIGMTQVYDDKGRLVPVTVISVGPCPVTQIKPGRQEGFCAVQIAYKPLKASRYNKPQLGHFGKAGLLPYAHLIEFQTQEQFDLGAFLTVKRFSKGQLVDVSAETKGHGFQGVMKRWNFAGGPASHGSMFHRRGGGFGQRQEPGEIQKNRKMPGQMGGKMRTTQNLEVIEVHEDKNIIIVKGSVPGAEGTLVIIRDAIKQ